MKILHTGLICLCWLAMLAPLSAQEYPVRAIPEGLRDGVHAVLRLDERSLTIHNAEKATLVVTRVVTVLDRQGDTYSQLVVPFDDEFQKVAQISGALYDAAGNRLEKLKSGDVLDRGTGSLSVEDTRYKYAHLRHRQYPYTVMYTYEVSYKGLLNYPSWMPLEDEDVSLEKGELLVVVPSDMDLRFRPANGMPEPVAETGDKETRYRVTLREVVPVEPEFWAPRTHLPILRLAPNTFKIDSYAGQAETWQDFGAFIAQLNTGRDVLPPALAQQVQALTTGLTSDADKIAALYRFLQENTRYVSIQLGIGGWQPFPASYVYEKGYGDCKALSNYMVALLRAAGIEAHYALVYASRADRDIQADFPANQFNHVIVCVPQGTDSLWLECTSKDSPPGYVGNFTDARHALLIKADGGHLVRTPAYVAEDNYLVRNSRIRLAASGDAEVEMRTTYGNEQQDIVRDMAKAPQHEREKWLREAIAAGSFELKAHQIEVLPSFGDARCALSCQLAARGWAKASGARLFLTVNQFEPVRFVPEKKEPRTQPVRLPSAWHDIDTAHYELPPQSRIEAMPGEPVEIETDFAYYRAELTALPDGTLRYVREMKVHKMELPAARYEDVRAFYQAVMKADAMQVVLSNNS